jgi:carboxyl-terminal processing protease
MPKNRNFSLMTGSSASGSGLEFVKQTQPNPRLAQRAGHYIMTNPTAGGASVVDFPIGASLDARRRIQLDSDYTGKGGVSPQIRIPRTYDNMLAVGQGQDVELKAAERELAQMLSSEPRVQPAK